MAAKVLADNIASLMCAAAAEHADLPARSRQVRSLLRSRSDAAPAAPRARKEKHVVPMRSVGLWNGEEPLEGATMGLFFSQTKEPSQVDFGTRLRDFLIYPNVLATTLKMVEIWKPLFVSVEPVFYDPVFKDRPGVGWMLYLPRVLTAQQVPEARALVPVMTEGDGKKQKPAQVGTIIVSVTDEPFSDENPEHVKIANAIEIRLVDQDLLPRYAEL